MNFFCINCKAEIDQEFRACPHCGERVTDFLRQYLTNPIDGKYRILTRLGMGGMGEVFKVLHVHLNAVRVIKLMRPAVSDKTEAHERFIREARMATAIHHHNVATLHDFSTLGDGSYYMVWEYIEGVDLTHLIRNRGTLPPRYTAQIAIQALRGLDAIHRAGIVHRDISPDNIMVSGAGTDHEAVKIIDLGIAKRGGAADDGYTQTGMFVGKWKYCSPEHLGFLPDGEKIDGRADLYSFGIVMYEMLTGLPPFIADGPQQYILSHSRETPKPLRIVNPRLIEIPELEAMIFKSLEKDRNDRFQSAREFADALERALPLLPATPVAGDDEGETVSLAGALPQAGAAGVAPPTLAVTAVPATQPSSPVRERTLPDLADDATAVVSPEPPPQPAAPAASAAAPPLPAPALPHAPPPARSRKGLFLGLGAAALFFFAIVAAGGFLAARHFGLIGGAAGEVDGPGGQLLEASLVVQPDEEVLQPPLTATSPGQTPAADMPPLATTPATTTDAPASRDSVAPLPPARETAPPPAIADAVPAAESEPAIPRDMTQEWMSDTPPPGMRLTDSRDYRSRFRRGIIQRYDLMVEGEDVDWFYVAPHIRLGSYALKPGTVRNFSGRSGRFVSALQNDLQRSVTRSGTGRNRAEVSCIVFTAREGSGSTVGIEAVFHVGDNVIAAVRHTGRGPTLEAAARDAVSAISSFIHSHPVNTED
jgi:eukaryotic-like serine/threonine-protein kinase